MGSEHVVAKEQLLWTAGKDGLGGAVLACVISRHWSGSTDGNPGIRDALAGPMQPLPLLAATVCCAGAMFLTFARWFVLVRALELPFRLRDAVRLGLAGFFF